MKSIVALIALVAVANAGVVLEDGYIGTWFDTMIVEGSTVDQAAPVVADIVNTWDYSEYWDATNGVLNVTEWYNELDVEFTTPIAADSTYGQCWMSYKLWNEAGDTVLNEIVCDCYMYSTYANCAFARYIPTGTYVAELTVSDWMGNWAVIEAADDGLWDVTVANLWVDTMAPVIVTHAPMTAPTVTIPADNANAETAGAYIQFMITAHDNDITDDFSTGVYGAGAWITDSEGVEMWMDIPYETYDYDTAGNLVNTYEGIVQFYNWADAGVWTLDSLAVFDGAGNWDEVVTDFAMTLMTDVTEEDSGRPPQCDTFELGLGYDDAMTSDYDTIQANLNTFGSIIWGDSVYFSMVCNVDYVGTNYAGALFASPSILLAGEDTGAPLWVQTDEGVLPPLQYTTAGDYDTPTSIPWVYPGAEVFSTTEGAYWSDSWGVYNGYPNGDYMLDRVYTTTETGAVQVYDSALGSASSVVPSVLVVAVALVAAMLRL